MSPHIPWYLTAVVIGTGLAIAGAVWLLVSKGADRTLPPDRRRAVRVGSAAFLAVWLGAVVVLAPSTSSLATRDPFYLTPLIPFFAAVPLALAALGLWRVPTLRRAVAGIPLPMLIGVQAWRIIGVVFVMLHARGLLPAHFALPAGWGDFRDRHHGPGACAGARPRCGRRQVPGRRVGRPRAGGSRGRGRDGHWVPGPAPRPRPRVARSACWADGSVPDVPGSRFRRSDVGRVTRRCPGTPGAPGARGRCSAPERGDRGLTGPARAPAG